MTSRTRKVSEKSNGSKMDDSTRSLGRYAGMTEMEYFWTIELNADKKTFTWMNNEDMEEDDEDFIEHTLFLKAAALGANAVSGETNVVMLESAGSEGETQKGAIINLCRGQNNMTALDLSLSGKVGPTTFTLVEGSGPIFISGNHLMEYPKEDDLLDNSQTESEEEETEDEVVDEEEGEEAEEDKAKTDSKKAVKRKAAPIAGKAKQKAKMDVDEEEEEEEAEEEEEEEDEEEEAEEEEPSEEDSEDEVQLKKAKKEKGKVAGKKETPKAKAIQTKKVKKTAAKK